MTDYECPECGGGFPASHTDGCPWCGESFGDVDAGLGIGDPAIGSAAGVGVPPARPEISRDGLFDTAASPDLNTDNTLTRRMERASERVGDGDDA
jgi:hypothetical protein